jgi:UDP-3-O-[3-hydroxymyristoyl] glucosamine N-acyltransferase
MLDDRFYIARGAKSVEMLFPDCRIKGDRRRLVSGAAAAERAGPNDLAYIDRRLHEPLACAAGAIVTEPENAEFLPPDAVAVLGAHPRGRFANALRELVAERAFQERAPPVAADAVVEAGARLAPGVVVGPGARIGADAEIGPNAVIGPGVTIGRRTRIAAGVSIRCALIGDDVTILSGAVVGEPGFAIAASPRGLVEVPHIGRVILQDRVLLGANVTVDRGLFDDTVICEDAKIDNLSQIAHNVTIGRNVVMAAFAGISGSTSIGDGVMLGGRVGVADHVTIGKGASLAANTALFRDVPERAVWGGFPGQSLRGWLREVAWLSKASRRRDAGE